MVSAKPFLKKTHYMVKSECTWMFTFAECIIMLMEFSNYTVTSGQWQKSTVLLHTLDHLLVLAQFGETDAFVSLRKYLPRCDFFFIFFFN